MGNFCPTIAKLKYPNTTKFTNFIPVVTPYTSADKVNIRITYYQLNSQVQIGHDGQQMDASYRSQVNPSATFTSR